MWGMVPATENLVVLTVERVRDYSQRFAGASDRSRDVLLDELCLLLSRPSVPADAAEEALVCFGSFRRPTLAVCRNEHLPAPLRAEALRRNPDVAVAMNVANLADPPPEVCAVLWEAASTSLVDPAGPAAVLWESILRSAASKPRSPEEIVLSFHIPADVRPHDRWSDEQRRLAADLLRSGWVAPISELVLLVESTASA